MKNSNKTTKEQYTWEEALELILIAWLPQMPQQVIEKGNGERFMEVKAFVREIINKIESKHQQEILELVEGLPIDELPESAIKEKPITPLDSYFIGMSVEKRKFKDWKQNKLKRLSSKK